MDCTLIAVRIYKEKKFQCLYVQTEGDHVTASGKLSHVFDYIRPQGNKNYRFVKGRE